MGRVAAGRVVAGMQDVQAIWDWSNGELIGQYVSAHDL